MIEAGASEDHPVGGIDQPPPVLAPRNSAPDPDDACGGGCEKVQTHPNKFERYMLRWTGVVAIFTGLLFVGALLQWRSMQGQLKEMRAEQRPWVGIDKIVVPQGHDPIQRNPDGSLRFAIEMDLTNVGKLPSYVFAKAESIIEIPVEKWSGEQEKFCASAPKLSKVKYKWVILPGGQFSYIDNATLKGKFASKAKLSGAPTSIMIIGCIYYWETGASHEVGKTGFVSITSVQDPGVPQDAPIPFPAGDIVVPSGRALRFIKPIMSGEAN